jgi:hypothetical protein
MAESDPERIVADLDQDRKCSTPRPDGPGTIEPEAADAQSDQWARRLQPHAFLTAVNPEYSAPQHEVSPKSLIRRKNPFDAGVTLR